MTTSPDATEYAPALIDLGQGRWSKALDRLDAIEDAVATRLYLSPRTIDAHLRSVFSKLGITSRTQLVRHQPAGALAA